MTTVRQVPGRVPRAQLAAALGTLLALAAALPAVLGRVVLHDCLVAEGPLAALGVRLAVLRSAVECPDGSFALGATSQGAVILLSVAVPVVVAHVVLSACGLGLGVLARRGVAAAAAVVSSRLAPPVALALPGVPAGPVRTAVDAPVHVRHDRGHDPRRPRRGPPVR